MIAGWSGVVISEQSSVKEGRVEGRSRRFARAIKVGNGGQSACTLPSLFPALSEPAFLR